MPWQIFELARRRAAEQIREDERMAVVVRWLIAPYLREGARPPEPWQIFSTIPQLPRGPGQVKTLFELAQKKKGDS